MSDQHQTRRPDRLKAADGCISLPQAARIAAVPQTTLDLWVRTGLVEPSDSDSTTPGTGHHRRFNLTDLTAIVTVSELKRQGVNVRKLRQVQAKLRGYGRNFANCRLALVSRGDDAPVDVVLLSSARDENALATSLVASPGQYVIASIDLRPVERRARSAFRTALKEKPAIRGRRSAKSSSLETKVATG